MTKKMLDFKNIHTLMFIFFFPVILCCLSITCFFAGPVNAQEKGILASAEKIGMSCMYGMAYDPEDAHDFVLVNGFLLFDYEFIWRHVSPDNLKFKVDFSIGSTIEEENDLLISSGFQALYYLEKFETQRFKPYFEAGIGLIYTDYKVVGQGMHLNFNPRAGMGVELKQNYHSQLFFGLRFWHMSNGSLNSENRGSNAVLFVVGSFFE